jgi:hypothetical protein
VGVQEEPRQNPPVFLGTYLNRRRGCAHRLNLSIDLRSNAGADASTDLYSNAGADASIDLYSNAGADALQAAIILSWMNFTTTARLPQV